MAAELQVEIRSLADGRRAAAFTGEVDVTNVGRFKQTLADAAMSGSVVADLTGLTYLDSAGIEVLFSLANRTALAVVAGPESRIRHVLEVVSLGTVATVLDEPPA